MNLYSSRCTFIQLLTFQKRQRAVLELHDDSVEDAFHHLNVQHHQADWLEGEHSRSHDWQMWTREKYYAVAIPVTVPLRMLSRALTQKHIFTRFIFLSLTRIHVLKN